MLHIENLHAFYAKSHILHGVSMTVEQGNMVALLGRNGSGRSTLAKAIMGLVKTTGSILWRGQQLVGKQTFEIARQGVGYVPESRDIFPTLTVEQNLMLGQRQMQIQRSPRWSMDDMYAMFPRLKSHQHQPAGVMSGGEQQMLALCRTLMGDPNLLVVDEPTEGLAPKIVVQVGQLLQTLKARGVSILLMEQKLTLALDMADRCCVMGHGQIVFDGSPAAFCADRHIRREWLEV
jgi:branched-chain amino acid transport system ATP-binding protein